MHAETVLLVDHREAEIGEGDIVLHQRMGADGNIERAARQTLPASRGARRLVAAGDQGDASGPRLRAAARWWRNAGGRGFRSGPSAPPAARLRSPAPWRAGRPRSCRSRHRPATGATCAFRWRDRPRFPRPPFSVRRSGRRAAAARIFAARRPSPFCARPCKICIFRRTSRKASWCDKSSSIGEPGPNSSSGARSCGVCGWCSSAKARRQNSPSPPPAKICLRAIRAVAAGGRAPSPPPWRRRAETSPSVRP